MIVHPTIVHELWVVIEHAVGRDARRP